MARQIGNIQITGTIEDFCFYKMQGQYFVRRKSTLASQRFWKEEAFAGSRRSAGLLGQASSLASTLYRRLPKEKRGRAVYQKLTGIVKRLLSEGWNDARVAHWFQQTYLDESVKAVAERKPAGTKNIVRTVGVTGAGRHLATLSFLPQLANRPCRFKQEPVQRLYRLALDRGSPRAA